MQTNSSRYVGRFAPSPSGPLHLGSMLTAVASYLEAKSNRGLWHLRIDDLDPPRIVTGSCQQILNTLEKYHLAWDGDVVYQSQRNSGYQDYLQHCIDQNLTYPCNCPRHKIMAVGGIYPGTCLTHPPSQNDSPCAIRIKTPDNAIKFEDDCQGMIEQHIPTEVGDFIIKRKDGLFAYHLACVVDDHLQGITHIVRGRDLLDSTPRQIYLQQILNFSTPSYCHLPIVVNQEGFKLSKQAQATNIDLLPTNETLSFILSALGLTPPQSVQDSVPLMLQWGIDHWSSHELTDKLTITESSLQHYV